MRSFVSGVATLIAIVAIIVALPSLWIKERVIDPEGFASSAMSTIAANPRVQSYMADEIANQVVAASNGLVPTMIAKPIAQRRPQARSSGPTSSTSARSMPGCSTRPPRISRASRCNST